MTETALISAGLAFASVGLHLGCLRGLLYLLPRLRALRHVKVGVMVIGALAGHLLEIGLFGAALSWLVRGGRHGGLDGTGAEGATWGDYYYYSAVTYTSLGFGDLTPTGDLRLLAAVEVLTGVVLVAWTASFLFLVMQKSWESHGS